MGENNNDGHLPSALMDGVTEGDFPSRLIQANKNFETALANCVIRDEEHRNAIIIYVAQLRLFNMAAEIQDVTNFLNGSISIGGFGRVIAASSHIGMLHPSTLGVKLHKEGEKAWAEAAMYNKRGRDRDRDGDRKEEKDD